MKKYDELTARLLERRDSYVAAQAAKRKRLMRVALPAGGGLLVALLCVGLWQGGAFENTPPVTDGSGQGTTVPAAPMTATGDSAPTDADGIIEGADTTVTTVTTTDVTPSDTVTGDSTQGSGTATQRTEPTTGAPTKYSTTGKTDPTATTTDGGIVAPTTPTTSVPVPSQTTTPSKTQPTATTPSKTEPSKTNPTQPTASQTQPTATQTKPTQTTPTTQPTVTDPSGEDPAEPMPEWPYLWIIYESGENYANGEVPIYFKLEGFEEVPFGWVKETSYTADGFSVVGDITVERDAETGALIYRMVLAYDGVTPKPSFFFSVVTADGMKQTDGLYGYPAPHGFFVSSSYDSAFSASQYYLVETGVITHDEYQAIMEKYWSQFGFEFSIVVDNNSH